jgi:hypothetical protein
MGTAYIRFASANPAHYRIMFGQFKDLCESDASLAGDASAAFQVLLDALATLERDGVVPGGGRRADRAHGGSDQRRDRDATAASAFRRTFGRPAEAGRYYCFLSSARPPARMFGVA